MTKLKSIFTLSIALCAFTMASNAQDTQTDNHTIGIAVPQVAILDIEPAASKNITMPFIAPAEAGLPLTAPANNSSLWLNYSVIKNPTKTYKVSVKVGAVIPGVDVKVTAGAASADGDGTKGTPTSQLTLTATDQIIINGIGSSYTGDGAKGHNLTYNVSAIAGSYSAIEAATNTATVTYTIAEN